MSDGAADGLAAWVAPKRTALVVIDIQEDFASPDGILGKMGLDLSAVPAAIAATEKLLAAAHSACVPVIFVGLKTTPETDSAVWGERARRAGEEADEAMALCRAGRPGSRFYGVAPAPGDHIVFKTRYSAFHGTDFDDCLKALDVDTLVLCGLTTECCIDCTARDAFHRDYHVILPTDACAAYGDEIHAAAVTNLVLNCAIATQSNDVASAWMGRT